MIEPGTDGPRPEGRHVHSVYGNVSQAFIRCPECEDRNAALTEAQKANEDLTRRLANAVDDAQDWHRLLIAEQERTRALLTELDET